MRIIKFSILVFSFICIFQNNGHAQVAEGPVIKMTAQEYTALISTIVKARKRKTARRYIYQLPAPLPPAYSTNQRIESQTNSKIEELERVYEQILNQQSQESSKSNNQSELEEIRKNLNTEIEQLRTRLESEQVNQTRDNELQEYLEKRDSRYLEDQRYSDKRANDHFKKQSNLEAHNKYLEDKIQRITSEQEFQRQKNKELSREIENLNRNIKNLATTNIIHGNKMPREAEERIAALNKQVLLLEQQQARLEILATQQPSENGDKSFDADLLKAYDKQIVELQLKIAALEAKPAIVQKSAPDNSELVKALRNQIALLENQLNAHTHITPAPINTAPPVSTIPTVSPTPTTRPKEDVKTFVTRHRQHNVYFPNGSSQLTGVQYDKIQQIANWLSTYQSLDITIKGYASNVGSLAINQRLSRERAESVKQQLLAMGVQTDRIILQPLGIDTVSTDPANARRAEVHLIIRDEILGAK